MSIERTGILLKTETIPALVPTFGTLKTRGLISISHGGSRTEGQTSTHLFAAAEFV